MDRLTDWLESQDFYELCQAYRHARDGMGSLERMQSAAECFKELKRQIKAQSLSHEAVRDEVLEKIIAALRRGPEPAIKNETFAEKVKRLQDERAQIDMELSELL